MMHNKNRRNQMHQRKKKMSNRTSTLNTGSSGIELVVQGNVVPKTNRNVNRNRKRGGVNKRRRNQNSVPLVDGNFPKLQRRGNIYAQNRQFDRALEEPNEQYPQINLIPITVQANAPAVWDFCVAYASTAMWNAQTADDFTTLLSGGQIGTWHMAALTLFYSLYQCSVGAVPVLQKVSAELMNLMHAFSPCNYKNVSYIVRWQQPNIIAYMQGLSYRSFSNTSISLAPWTGVLDTFGRRVLSNTVPTFTLDDFTEIGPRAFEYAQRSLLGDRVPLIDYTMEGPYKDNTAIFCVPRDFPSAGPVSGFTQVINESPMWQSDYWLASLGFANVSSARDSYNCRTVQSNTLLAMRRIMTGDTTVNQVNFQMIDIGTVIAQEVATMVAGDVNILDKTLKDLDNGSGPFPSEYLGELLAGDWLTKILADCSRRWGKLSCMAAGSVLPGNTVTPPATLIGGGSAYLIGALADNSSAPLGLIEDLAGLSSFVDEKGCFFVPLLVTQGNILTLDMLVPTGRSLLYWLEQAFPTMEGVFSSYNLATPGLTDIPDNLDLSVNTVSFTSGPGPSDAINTVSSVIELMQGNVAIGNASGSNDAYQERHLYMTHVLETAVNPDRYNRTATLICKETLSTRKFNQREVASKFSRLFPVFFVPPTQGTAPQISSIPAYQQLYRKTYSTDVQQTYTEYRIQGWVAQAHELSANFFSPSEQTARATHKTIIGEGGAFYDIFFKDGKWVSALEHLAQGIGGLFSPEAAQWGKSLAGKTGRALHEAFKSNGLPSYVRNPVDSGMITRREYQAVLEKHVY